MSLHSTIESIGQHLTEAWDAVEEAGGGIPEQKNLANLVESIRTIGSEVDPTQGCWYNPNSTLTFGGSQVTTIRIIRMPHDTTVGMAQYIKDDGSKGYVNLGTAFTLDGWSHGDCPA